MCRAEYLILIIIVCVSLQYIGISYCECSFQLYKDMDPHFQPVYFIKDAKKKSYTLATQKLVKTRNYIVFDEKETLIITCPNETGQQERYYEIDIFLLCGPDNEWTVTKGAHRIPPKTTPNEYKCEFETGFYFKKESHKTDAKKQCKSMNGVFYHIGIYANLDQKWLRKYTQEILQAIMPRKITYQWFTLYSVCVTEGYANPIYAHYTIDEEKINNRQMKLTKYGENDMRNPTKNWQHQIYMFSKYQKENIWEKINAEFKGKLNSFFNVETHYFVPAGLVQEDAMSFSSWRYATHFTMNVVPMWKQVSCTWKNIENVVKQAALQVGSTLDIYSGTFKKLVLPTSEEEQRKGRGTNISFGEAFNSTLYVPAILWKLIYNKETGEAVIFLLHNNPYRTDRPEFRKSYCKNICGIYGWKIENEITKLGETYCCNPKEFFTKNKEFEKFGKNFEFKDVLSLPNSKLDTESD